MTDSQNKDGITKDSTLIPKLTTVTNKRLTSSMVTVSDIINDSTSLGLSRTSTLILDPPVNYGIANITNNGRYIPSNFNSSGNYDPTHSAGWDYIDQINVNVKIKFNRFYISSNYKTLTNFTVYSNSISSFVVNSGEAVVRIVESDSSFTVNLLVNNDSTNKTINLTYDSGKINKYVKFGSTNGSSVLKLCYNNNSSIIEINDESLDVNFSYVTFSKNSFVIE